MFINTIRYVAVNYATDMQMYYSYLKVVSHWCIIRLNTLCTVYFSLCQEPCVALNGERATSVMWRLDSLVKWAVLFDFRNSDCTSYGTSSKLTKQRQHHRMLTLLKRIDRTFNKCEKCPTPFACWRRKWGNTCLAAKLQHSAKTKHAWDPVLIKLDHDA